jgi:putative transposase
MMGASPERQVTLMSFFPRGPRPTRIRLSQEERQALETLVHRHTTAHQLVVRARIVLAAADGLNNAQIARQFAVSLDTARLWRQRWLSTAPAEEAEPLAAAARLSDLPRSGAPLQFTAEQMCQLVALACEVPEGSDRPISHWSRREITAEALKRGIFPQISDRHVGRFLKRCGSETALDPLLADALAQRAERGTSGED